MPTFRRLNPALLRIEARVRSIFISLFLSLFSGQRYKLMGDVYMYLDTKKIVEEVFRELRNLMLKENGEDKIIRESRY